MMLSIEELTELEEAIMELLPDTITQALAEANRLGKLDELLRLLKVSELLGGQNTFDSYKEGKIVVIGGTEVKEKVLLGIATTLGIEKTRFEFHLNYEDAKTLDFEKMQYNPSYRLILFGPTPHSGHGKGKSRSIISQIENTAGYPKVERLMSGNELKITKSNFRDKLEKLIVDGYITNDQCA